MKKHKIECGKNYWTIMFPDTWDNDFDEENYGEYIFFPENSDLTIRITPFHAENNEGLAPEDTMRDSFLTFVGKNMGIESVDRVNLKEEFFEKLDGFKKLAFQKVYVNDFKEVLWISIGIYKEGELLTFNILGTDKNECIQSLLYLRNLEFFED